MHPQDIVIDMHEVVPVRVIEVRVNVQYPYWILTKSQVWFEWRLF